MTHPLRWQKFPVLDQGFICLVDVMGDDSAIVQAARVSYGKDEQCKSEDEWCELCHNTQEVITDKNGKEWPGDADVEPAGGGSIHQCTCVNILPKADRQLIRYLMNHSHTTPFEMVEIKFMVQVPMDAWRQWVRHRTANINEYSTRYTEALDFMQQTSEHGWRLQASDNKQGSSGFLTEWPLDWSTDSVTEKYAPQGPIDTERSNCKTPGQYLTSMEEAFHEHAKIVYQERLSAGIAKEQARKDLPLSTYTRLYWKCDLHNIFNFLRLRMDSHAQLEIRTYANAMYEIVKQICPVACEAFEDYVLHAKKFSSMEMEVLRDMANQLLSYKQQAIGISNIPIIQEKPFAMTDREWKEFLAKLQ